MEVLVSALAREQVEGLGHGVSARNLGERWRLEVPERSLADVIQRVQQSGRAHPVRAADASVARGVLRRARWRLRRREPHGRRLSRVLAVAANTFRETIRERVLYNLVFFAILMTLSGLLLGQLSIRQDEKIIKDLGLAAMDVFGTVIAIFIGVGLVAKEIERRSLYPLLAKPLSRGELLLGKFAGLAFTLLVNVAVMALGLYLTLLLTGRRLDLSLLKAVYGIYLGLLVVLALALFFSTVTSSAVASVCTVSVVAAGRFSDVIRNMNQVTTGVPTFMTEFLYWLLPNFRNFDFKNAVVYGLPVPFDLLALVTLYAAVYTSVVLLLALAAFRSKDFQ